MSKPLVAVFFGGRSAEHDVSIITGIGSVIKPLNLSGEYQTMPVYIAKDGKWYSHPDLASVATFTSAKIDGLLKKLRPLEVSVSDGLWLIQPTWSGAKRIKIDIAFPAMHGTYGEDGSLMGVFRMANVPYVGCDVSSSGVAMDKVLCKLTLEGAKIPNVKFTWFNKPEYVADPKPFLAKVKKLKYPLFVKPAHLGSSIGINKVDDAKDLNNAIEVAIHYDNKVIVEEGVNNLVEVTVPVMGHHELQVAMVEEALPDKGKFFDFESKYIGGKKGKGKKGKNGESTVSRIPAKISKELYSECERLAKETFRAIGGSGIARVDMLIDKKASKVYVNEVNTLPGFLYNHNWRRAGVSNVELVSELIKFAYERHEEQQALTTTFNTNYLKQF